MLNLTPEISIIIPTYNRARLISESLDSILAQSFKRWECIIVDDHSKDNTVAVINEYIKLDKRFKLFKRPGAKKKGANSCRNYGLIKSNGKFIHWFDSDDIAHPRYLQVSYDLINKHKVDFCHFHRSVFFGGFHYNFKNFNDTNLSIIKINSSHIEALLKNKLVFNTCNVLWRKESLGKERFSENIVYADEWEYYSRLLANNLQGISINMELFFGRKHADSTTYEFANNDPVRKASKIKAVKMVIENLSSKGLLSQSIVKYFIQLGFQFNEPEIIQYALKISGAKITKIIKYKLGYVVYPVLKPFLKLKGKIKNG